MERASQVDTRFAISDRNAAALASVCHRLDGIPLAIELAAARTRSMTIEEVDRRLDRRFDLLTRGSRVAPARQQTLRALVDWSYDLLDASERALLCRLSVFAGGWMLDAAELVCAGESVEEYEVIDLLASLADKSLVFTEQACDATRYRMLETVRQYAAERLRESGQADLYRDRHGAYFLALAERAAAAAHTPEQQEWQERLSAEHDNLRAALDACAAGIGPEDAGLRFVQRLGSFWLTRGHISEGRRWCDAILAGHAASPPSNALGAAVHNAGNMAYVQASFADARRNYERAAGIFHELGDRTGEAGARVNLATIDQMQGKPASAILQFERSLEIFEQEGNVHGRSVALGCLAHCSRQLGDQQAARDYTMRGIALAREAGDRAAEANARNVLGTVYRGMGDETGARQEFELALAINRSLNYTWETGITLVNLAGSMRCAGDHGAAVRYMQEAVELLRSVSERRLLINCIDEMAELEVGAERNERAARLLGASAAARRALGVPPTPWDSEALDRMETTVRAAIGGERLHELTGEGGAMTLDEAIDYGLLTP